MRRLCRGLAVSFCFSLLVVGMLFFRPDRAYAMITPAELASEIDQFQAAGADAYLVWQFSGDRTSPFANDPYSFFKGDPICGVLKDKSSKIKVGVNMWDAGAHDQAAIQSNFQYLKSECGVSVVRVFAYAGGTSGLSTVMSTAAATGMQLIVTIGDYSNGGGGVPKGANAAWYSAGFRGEYLSFANQVQSVIRSNSGIIYALELANEPHCGGDAGAIGAYTSWVRFMAGDLAGSGAPIAIGQMASQDTTRCDSPPDDYRITNNVGGISKSSAHYYKADEKVNALEAAGVAKSLGKTFYIGEANYGDDLEDKRASFVYPGIEDMAPDVTKMRQMAAGYTLTCGNQFKIKGDIKNEDVLKNRPPGYEIDCDANPWQCTIAGVWANVILDNTKTTIPLYRFEGAQVPNPDSPKRRLDDLEGFFGANYTKNSVTTGADQFLAPLANGVSRKLIGESLQCEMTLQYLQTIKQLCDQEGNRSGYTYNDKLDADAVKAAAALPPTPKPTLPPGECALYSKILGADPQYDSYKKILDQIPTGFKCSQPNAPGWSAWYKEFSKIELTTPKGFKPAYLVHYIDRPETPQTNLDKRVVWLAPGEDANGGIGDPRNITDRIKIVKVYVPAGFAEINIDSVNNNPALANSPKQPTFFPTYTGGFMQTITSIIPSSLQTKVITDRILKVGSIVQDMISGNIFDGQHEGIVCKTCAQNSSSESSDPRITIIRRINAEFLDPSNQVCNRDDLVGETAKERIHTINPPGTLDPVKPAVIPVTATMVANKPASDNRTVKTFLLLPEEYRNIVDYEPPFLQTFTTTETQDVTKHPELAFVTNKTELAANPRAAYKYLQLSGETADLKNPEFKGADLGYDITDPNATPVLNPDTGNSSTPSKHVDGQLSAQISTEKGISEIKTDPQVPGGKLARTLWEIMCNVTRPHDNLLNDKLQTVDYPGFEKFLQKGIASCTDGAQPSTSSFSDIADAFCQGTTTIPPELRDPTLTKLHAYVNGVEQQKGIPKNLLWGIINIEGSPALRAMRSGQTSLTCGPPDRFGSAGPLQLQSSQCGGFGTWEQNSAGVTGGNCGLTASIQVAGNLLVRLSTYSSVASKSDRWYRAAGMYNGLCLSDEQAGASAPSCTSLDLRNSNRCSGAPAVQGCNGNNYCVCAKDGFN